MTTNFTSYAGIATILGALEANLSIVCACLPLFRPLVTLVSERINTIYQRRTMTSRSKSSYLKKSSSSRLGYVSHKNPGNLTTEDEQEERLKKQINQLYPLSATAGSIDEISYSTWIPPHDSDFNATVKSGGVETGGAHFEMENIHREKNVEPFSAINVTKSWRVE
jgi:hypothetical protein